MADKRTIEVYIDQEGHVNLETKGFTGKSCAEATKEIELALGKVKSTEKTAEYFKDPKEKDAWITQTGE